MAVEKTLGTAKRFGPRYGRTVKEKLAKIERELRKKHKCPYCNHTAVKRVAVGIWFCRKCNQKFTGKAYSPIKRIIVKEKAKEEVIEEIPEEELTKGAEASPTKKEARKEQSSFVSQEPTVPVMTEKEKIKSEKQIKKEEKTKKY